MRGRLLVLMLAVGCEPKEIGEEFFNDDLGLTFSAPAVTATGSSISGSISDACGSAQNDDCEDNNWTITSISCSGALLNCNPSGSGFSAQVDRMPGYGSIFVNAADGNITTSGSFNVNVLEPDGAIVRPSCANGGLPAPQAPYKIAAATTVTVTWQLLLMGQQHSGDNGEVLAEAPDFTFIEKVPSGAFARYTSPTAPGIYTVRSTIGETTMFDYEVYAPAALTTLELVESTSPPVNWRSFSLRGSLDGAPTCDDPGIKTVRTLTPSICMLRSRSNASMQVDMTETDTMVLVDPVATGTCQLGVTMANSSVAQTFDIEVTPL